MEVRAIAPHSPGSLLLLLPLRQPQNSLRNTWEVSDLDQGSEN